MLELEKAASALPERILMYPNIEWPLYILHDVKKNGSHFSFGLLGNPDWGDRDGASKILDYADAGKLIPTPASLFEPLGVDFNSPHGRELRLAGRTYGGLLAIVYESLLGETDRPFLSQFSGQRSDQVKPVK
jgi:hypothetical protein